MSLFNPTPTAPPTPTVSTAQDEAQLGFFQKNRKGLLLIAGCVALLVTSRLLSTRSRAAIKEVKAGKVVAVSNHEEADKLAAITDLQTAFAAAQQASEIKTQQDLAARMAANQLTPEQLQQLAQGGGASPAAAVAVPTPRQQQYNSAETGVKPVADKPATLVISYREQQVGSKDVATDVPAVPPLPPGYGQTAPPAAPPNIVVADNAAMAREGHGPVEKHAGNQEDRQHNLAAFTGEKFRIREGTWIPCTELLRINGSFASDINCLVSIPIYTTNGDRLLIAKGTLALGHVAAVSSQNQQRLFVVFDRFIMPDGYTVEYDDAAGLDQIGQAGLRDKVNHHYLQMFGASLAIAAVGGLAQIGNYGNATITPGSQYRSGLTQGMSESATQILNRFATVLPTFVIREGARNNIHLPFNLWLPDYAKHDMRGDL